MLCRLEAGRKIQAKQKGEPLQKAPLSLCSGQSSKRRFTLVLLNYPYLMA